MKASNVHKRCEDYNGGLIGLSGGVAGALGTMAALGIIQRRSAQLSGYGMDSDLTLPAWYGDSDSCHPFRVPLNDFNRLDSYTWNIPGEYRVDRTSSSSSRTG